MHYSSTTEVFRFFLNHIDCLLNDPVTGVELDGPPIIGDLHFAIVKTCVIPNEQLIFNIFLFFYKVLMKKRRSSKDSFINSLVPKVSNIVNTLHFYSKIRGH